MKSALSPKNVAEINRLMTEAAACYNRDEIPAAERLCHEALSLFADFPQALHLLGLCQWRQNQWSAAAETLGRAASLNPKDAQVWHDLGLVYSMQGQWPFAIHAYLRAIELRPDNSESYLYLGGAYESLGEPGEAERAYRRALELNPASATAAASLGALCEAANRLEEAARSVEQALRTDPADAVANLTQAQLEFRDGRPGEAVARLEALLRQPLTPRNRSLALSRLGAAQELSGDFERAFESFRASKEALNVGDGAPAGPGFYTLESVQRVARHLPALLHPGWAHGATGDAAPVFLVGFPRSGTTLLDQMLSSHPKLNVLEEKETLQDLLRDFVTTDAGLEKLAALDTAALEPYRRQYWARVVQYLPQRSADRLFVDKLPLNTIFLPLITRLFPQARFLFAVRDPRDVVLSCFMRAFGLNEAMHNFLSLEGTATYYSAVMDIGMRAIPVLGQSLHLIRYEALVDDISGEAQRLCAFLGVNWEPDMLKFQETARQRRINTPSYHQVVQPIYRSARERWRNYAQHLQTVLPQLQPCIEYFGYA